ncbi:hypothetical protein CIB93_32995 [Streptomyces sp. WZ.A104]|uniref:hypothetical protein n=1 Tax=Streptomyces sp. WZ.A104 TaxID=2023771 RepID=UPI000BBC79C5|nr:hypothetical protein [Streptomyces sp. WZ.A104]PCG81892.1 hypothetical protein CIB93_32995 [Streptomyces sp. WZ.A104]
MNAAPRVLAVIDELLASAGPDARGALWHLGEVGRELDANLVRLPAGAEVGEHQEDVLDVLLLVVAGGGSLRSGDGQALELGTSTLLWLPRGSRRSFAAGPDGLAYVTVHRRRPGLAIKASGSGAYEGGEGHAGGEGPCMLDRVCPGCGRLSDDPAPLFCSRCGEPFPER